MIRKHKPHPNLNSYDYSWFARDDKETMDAFVAKYENKDERRNAMKNVPKNDSFIYVLLFYFRFL